MNPARRPSPLVLALCLCVSGCMSLTPQLQPTDFAKLETIKDRAEREKALKENWIFRHEEPQGTRYTKGLHPLSTKRSWQSLDAILRSEKNSAEALPYKELRRSRILAALGAVTGLLFIASGAATAREGFDFQKLNGANGVMLGSVLATVGLAIAAGVYYRRAEKGYARAVNIYNDSLGMRLGLLTPNGDYIPPADAAVDAEGYILTEDANTRIEGAQPYPAPGPSIAPAPAPNTTAPAPAPNTTAPAPDTTAPPMSAPPPTTAQPPQLPPPTTAPQQAGFRPRLVPRPAAQEPVDALQPGRALTLLPRR
ncbi:hypothetical protein OV203_09730 [Nannocystis sp. ILAH1]|uniref:hypothetical protein n=1 Tax=unclassified Nannocystis TaxID=2627009 RepID=UPI00226EE3B9|nr:MULTISPECIES: hypothetical protein [unclassified Nannocystis]MCY0987402.1 hypothetical protein [Nannocystis sp. ILAH1]MCY1070803.1 hypothetical protein [Nannocystis sp. RBIL2]